MAEKPTNGISDRYAVDIRKRAFQAQLSRQDLLAPSFFTTPV